MLILISGWFLHKILFLTVKLSVLACDFLSLIIYFFACIYPHPFVLWVTCVFWIHDLEKHSKLQTTISYFYGLRFTLTWLSLFEPCKRQGCYKQVNLIILSNRLLPLLHTQEMTRPTYILSLTL